MNISNKRKKKYKINSLQDAYNKHMMSSQGIILNYTKTGFIIMDSTKYIHDNKEQKEEANKEEEISGNIN